MKTAFNLKPDVINNEFNLKPACFIHPSVYIFELSSLHFFFTPCSLLQGKSFCFFFGLASSKSYAGKQFVSGYVRASVYRRVLYYLNNCLERMERGKLLFLVLALFFVSPCECEILSIFNHLMVKHKTILPL